MFDGIYTLLGLDVFNAMNMADFFPSFFRLLIAVAVFSKIIDGVFSMIRIPMRGKI